MYYSFCCFAEAQLGDKYLVTMLTNDKNGVAVDMVGILTDQKRMVGWPSSSVKKSSSSELTPPSTSSASSTTFDSKSSRVDTSSDPQQCSMTTKHQPVANGIVSSGEESTSIVNRSQKIEQVSLHHCFNRLLFLKF